MKKYKQKKTIELIETDRVCNKCGISINIEDNDYLNRISSVDICFGYGSMNDGSKWSFDICDDCLEQIVSEFKIPVRVTGHGDYFKEYI
jgi:hypothetical protein